MSADPRAALSSSLGALALTGYYWHPERYGLYVLRLRMPHGRPGVRYLLDALRAVAIAWLHMHARELVEAGKLDPEEVAAWCLARRPDLPPWDGGPIRNVIVLQGGHKLGKSVLAALVLLWLVDVVPRGLLGTVYAPTVQAAAATVWRYVRQLLDGGFHGEGKSPRPRVLAALMGGDAQPRLSLHRGEGIRTRAVPRGGTASIQGLYGRIGVAVVEEAEGIQASEFYDALRTMMSGGIRLWILNANPESPVSPFQRLGGPTVERFALSGLEHPNVIEGRTVFPGAITRGWIDEQLDSSDPWAERVEEHNPEQGTIIIPWREGIWRPHSTWFWRVAGVPPPNDDGDVWITGPLYRRACEPAEPLADKNRATLGVDCAGGGADRGVIARRWAGLYHIRRRIRAPETSRYVDAVHEELVTLLEGGCREVEIRVDNGGGYGLGVIDGVRSLPILDLFAEAVVVECHAQSPANDRRRFADRAAEGMGNLRADLLDGWRIVAPPPELEIDLTHRRAGWEVVSADGIDGRPERIRVRACEPKKRFQEREGRSPDDGDAMALAAAPWGVWRVQVEASAATWAAKKRGRG